MNRDKTSEHPLLSSYPHDDEEDVRHEQEITQPVLKNNLLCQLCQPTVLIALSCITVASLVLNTWLLYLQFSGLRHLSENVPQVASPATLMGKSAYTALGLDTPSIHYHHTEYWGKNQTRADELWESIDTNPMVVALSDDFADAHGLPRSDRFPWDETKGRYFVKVFHQLHCLVCIWP